MRRRTAAVVITLVVLLSVGWPPRGVEAQDQGPPPTGEPVPHMIPRPNSGHPPTDAGDLGGSLQLLLLGLIVVAITGGVLMVVRQSRQARSQAP